MRGRNTVDPELARVVEQRLERLLAERGPRRAASIERDETQAGDLDDWDTETEADIPEVLETPRRSRARTAKAEPVDRVDDNGPERRPLFTKAHLAVVGVLVALGLLLGGWAVLRAQPVPLPVAAVTESEPGAGVKPSAPTPAASSTARASPTTGSTSSSAAIVVHVVGSVRKPGLVELGSGARVQDAIDAAGGLKPGARLGDLNLAQPLVDGQQVVVGRAGGKSEVRGGTGSGGSGGTTGGTAGGTSNPAGGPTTPVDLNTATVAQLETLPGVGPVTAAKIIAWREEHGRFSRVEELQEVAGIGPKTYAEIAPHCRV